MNEKVANKEVFDFKIYDMFGNLIYGTETVRKNDIKVGQNRLNTLVIEDALFDADFAENVFNGKYRGLVVRVEGYTYVRQLNGKDKPMQLNIKSAFISDYKTVSELGELPVNRLIVIFPTSEKNNLTYSFPDEEKYW